MVSQGVDLSAYTSSENAADLNDLQLALGYDTWNIYGVSYGSRLALTVMRDFPDGIRSVILDSSYPLQVNLYTAVPPNAERAFTVLFNGCAADSACETAYPELEKLLFRTVDQLNDNPVTISITNPLTGESFDDLLNGYGLIGFVFQSLYSTEVIPLLPKIILDTAHGDFSTLSIIEGSFLLDIDYFSPAMYFSVQCGEEVSFSSLEEIVAAAEAYPRLRPFFDAAPNLGRTIFTICQSWDTRNPDPIENMPVISDIPTLVLGGEYDPITPPAWGELVAQDLSNSFYFEFPGTGHGAGSSGECPLSLALAFLDDPKNAPDESCISTMMGPAFVVPQREIVMVPFTDQDMGISGVVPEGWVELAPGAYGRSALGIVALIQQAVPQMPTKLLLELLAGRLGLTEPFDKARSLEANGLTWALHEAGAKGLFFDIAVPEDGLESRYFIMLQSTKSERDFHYNNVYLPAVQAFIPPPTG